MQLCIIGDECLAQILAQEVIGYHNVSLVALDDPRVGFDPVTQFGYISSCTDSRSVSCKSSAITILGKIGVIQHK